MNRIVLYIAVGFGKHSSAVYFMAQQTVQTNNRVRLISKPLNAPLNVSMKHATVWRQLPEYVSKV